MNDSSFIFKLLTDLLAYLELPMDEKYDLTPSFLLQVPIHYAQKIEKGNPLDPLLLQILPLLEENKQKPGFTKDPVGDLNATQEPGILQKYNARALVISTCACSLHCRFCFRKHFNYESTEALPDRLDRWLANHPDIKEIIFSGGDPLFTSPAFFKKLNDSVLKHETVKTIRFHSRLPVTDPDRLEPLLPILKTIPSQKNAILVSHVNHAQELDEKSSALYKTLREAGFTLLNQSVLLRGINDTVKALVDLSNQLFSQGVLPYYLHQLDKAEGTSHFEVPDHKAIHLLENIRIELPGYLVPRLVREIANEKSKTPLC
ncbi:MAG TPA: KamA family radical SAM protein [Fibrobacteraceae bacterium]|jgi:EF-P beta-lysylation protein EpmB|nr:KamA family radical SAM protein [Fibrobacter sp.]HPW94348.1 KamA family radical SAM protein [Fibrobacteraceae bacterium]